MQRARRVAAIFLLLFAFHSTALTIPDVAWAQTEQPDENGLIRYFLTVDDKQFSLPLTRQEIQTDSSTVS
jgi:hypothetical protein